MTETHFHCILCYYYITSGVSKAAKSKCYLLSTLKAGECLLIGEAVVLPSLVTIDECDLKQSSNDIPYFQLWKEEWKELDISAIKEEWYK